MGITEKNKKYQSLNGKWDTAFFRSRIYWVFFFLALGMAGLFVGYWVGVLSPQLSARAVMTSRAIATSHVRAIAEILESAAGPEIGTAVTETDRAVGGILLLADPETGTPFVAGIEIEADYGVVNAPEGALDVKRGVTRGDAVFEIPLYSDKTRELLGIARFHPNPEFIRRYKSDVRMSYLAGASVGFFVLLLAWRVAAALFAKIEKTELAVREKEAQIVHAGRLAAMGEMATGIAHEINQPLAIIRIAADGLAEWFSEQTQGTMEAKAADKIVEQVTRASAIIDNMRAFARPRNDAVEPVDLVEPATRALSFFREQFRIHQVGLDVSFPETPVMVRTNPQKFEQIVVNFLSNARYAVEKKAETSPNNFEKRIALRLYADQNKNEAVFEVRDNGIGMPPEVAERCMEPFFTTKEVGEGMGLGLSIVHGIVREFGMTIDTESVMGEGSVFRVRMATEL